MCLVFEVMRVEGNDKSPLSKTNFCRCYKKEYEFCVNYNSSMRAGGDQRTTRCPYVSELLPAILPC
jgi:hypothetical protein